MATRKAPGRSDRDGITLPQLFAMFPDNKTAEAWFASVRWPDGPRCPREGCGSANVQVGTAHKTMPYRCRACRKFFSVRVGTVMQDSKLGYQTWAIAVYLLNTGIKGTSSMKLHRDLGVTQRTAWHLAHRIRETWADNTNTDRFTGPVEVDETYIGGLAKNMHAKDRKRRISGTGGKDKAVVVGVLDRATGKVSAAVVPDSRRATLVPFVTRHTHADTTVFTDEHAAYRRLPRDHYAVRHSTGEYVRGMAHTNGIESFWSLLKRGLHGTFHHVSPKHLPRYVAEFAGRHNSRSADTAEQMRQTAAGMVGKLLPFAELVADAAPGTVAEPDRPEPW
ncbi:IS1595 family transposase [Candidatus Poriferisodalis sp.]|uniref:IS1595 family transposase n=1 Tax=Candidatus Poriferisodalis sp. TaxID=3101277 RepID=UPI003B015D49